MKRYILLTLTALVLHTGSLFAQSAQPREKSEAEIFMQQMAKEVKSNEIDYAYISTSMFRQLLSQALSIVDSDIKEALGVDNILSSVMYMRRFMSTGREGYELLHKAMQPFLEEEEELMGMQLNSFNRADGRLSIVYSDQKNVLVINEQEGDEDYFMVIFVSGVSYENFMKVTGNGGLIF
jgi:hypothetical protein